MDRDLRDTAICRELEEALADVVDGTADGRLYEHIAGCDVCRDLRHEASRAVELVRDASLDFRESAGFANRLAAGLDRAAPPAPVAAPAPTEAPPVSARVEAPADGPAKAAATVPAASERSIEPTAAPAPTVHAVTERRFEAAAGPVSAPRPAEATRAEPAPRTPARPARPVVRRPALWAGLAGSLAAAAAVGFYLAGEPDAPEGGGGIAAEGAVVTDIARAAADKQGGLSACDASGACLPVDRDAAIEAGAVLRTDARTRARVRLADGSEVALDRATELALARGGDPATLRGGALVLDRAPSPGAGALRIRFAEGELEAGDAKLALASTGDRASVEVARGSARLVPARGRDVEVRAGEEGTIARGGEASVDGDASLADAMEWSESDAAEGPELRGVGELRARRPGATVEKDRAVRLAKHSVKVRISSAVARTEVDETFTNDTDEELEGIFRFPLPPRAQIEGLALEVDGKLVEGAFVERDRGAAIWRGVIQNAAPTAPRPREEIIWVPGPWRDPALLEWQRGGRFELRIFPIPKRGSRRIVLSYTEVVEPAGKLRRFTYPLAHDAAGTTRIDAFDLDVQVLGHDPEIGVRARGYELEPAPSGAAADRRVFHAGPFVPSGDLTVEYALPDRDRQVTAWAYRAEGPGASPDDAAAYVALALRPVLPRWESPEPPRFAIVVDASRSMIGERYARATRLAAAMVREMDRRATFALLACDTRCRAMGAPEGSARAGSATLAPGAASAAEVERFLGGIEPDGASDLAGAVRAARAAAGGGRALRVVYLGDGTPSAGPTRPAHLEAAVRAALPAGDASVVAVALGAEADTTSLAALARGGGGVVVPYVPGQKLASAAIDALTAAYGTVLRDVAVELPPGLRAVTPSQPDAIRAGGEALVLARLDGPEASGTIQLTGQVAGERFEQSYPVHIAPTSATGNAFVPRLYAATRILELERTGTEADKAAIVALSRRFAVASRHTSLLVLESEAMFRAFGLDRSRTAPVFTGESAAESSSGEADALPNEAAATGDEALQSFADKKTRENQYALPATEALGRAPSAAGSAGPMSAPAPAAPRPAATTAAAAAPPRPAKAAKPAVSADRFDDWAVPPRRLVPMRRVFDRKAAFEPAGAVVADVAAKLAEAERALAIAPDSRDKTAALYALYATTGRLGEAQELTARWSGRDALDPDAIAARADLAARQGDRDAGLRVLGGLADVRPGDKAPLTRLAGLYDAAGDAATACAFRVALAEITSSDPKAVAAAVRCAGEQGQGDLAAALRRDADAKQSAAVDALLAAPPAVSTALAGDVRVSAEWSGAVDLDVALVDASGRRLSWLGAPAKIAVTSRDATSLRAESVAFAGLPAGRYLLEISRAGGAGDRAPARGEITLTLPGETRRVAFSLDGARAELGAVRVFFTSRLVPVDDWRVRAPF
jgi:hypothetical protein